MEKLRRTGQAQTAERKSVCITGVGDISEDPLDCRVGVGHENGPEWGGVTHCVFAEQNVYFFYVSLSYIFLCVMS